MTRLVLALALLTGCASQTPAVEAQGEGASAAGTITEPRPTPAWSVAPRRAPEASRSRRTDPSRATGTLSSTAYCETGLMANGHHTHRGAVAANRWPLGTRLHVSDSPYGAGTFTVTDRIGHGSQLDFAIPGDCPAALRWGRRTVRVEVTR